MLIRRSVALPARREEGLRSLTFNPLYGNKIRGTDISFEKSRNLIEGRDDILCADQLFECGKSHCGLELEV